MIEDRGFQDANAPAPEKRRLPFENCAPNLARGRLRWNVMLNSSRGLPGLEQAGGISGVACLCAPGPSLKKNLEAIAELAANGAAIWAVKGTWRVLQEAGIRTDACAMVDPDASQAGYVANAPAHIEWYLASQCDTDCFEALRYRDVFLWHNPAPETAGYMPRKCFGVIGGAGISSLALRLMAAQGARDIHCFGVDCSWEPEEPSHAYRLLRGRNPPSFNEVDGRAFLTTDSMMAEWFDIVNLFLADNGLHLKIHGDGMLAATVGMIMRMKTTGGDPRFQSIMEATPHAA